MHRKNMSSFFGRMYQVRYLSGIIAGMKTQTGEIGYVAAFPIPEVIRGINAFTLGVRSVRPDATVYVRYCNSWTEDTPAGTRTTGERPPNGCTISAHKAVPVSSDSVPLHQYY